MNPDKDKEYWNFSYHEFGIYDLPAMINFIKSTSNVEKILFVGHSLGTTQLFAGYSIIPEYFSENLNGFIALGPVTFLHNLESEILKKMIDYKIDSFFKFLGLVELFKNTETTSNLQKLICAKFGILCKSLVNEISDYNFTDDEFDRFYIFISHYPSGSSLKSTLHLAQNYRNKNFGMFDTNENYNLSNIKNFPVAIFLGQNDRLSTIKDNAILIDILKKNNSLDFYKVYENTGHVSFYVSKTNIFMEDLLRKADEYSK